MRWFGAIFLVPILTFGKVDRPRPSHPQQDITAVINAFCLSPGSGDVSLSRIKAFSNKMAAKQDRFRNDRQFLRFLFSKTHDKFLRQYRPLATFGELLNDGVYNCLTGIALYAVMLDNLGFDLQIIETNYHIFLLVKTTEGVVLLEATDPINGFEASREKIDERIAAYRSENLLSEEKLTKGHYQFNNPLYNTIKLENLPGLLHYNIAVDAFNKKDLTLAVDHLEHSVQSYSSSRIDEFSNVLLAAVIDTVKDQRTSQELTGKILKVKRSNHQLLASIR